MSTNIRKKQEPKAPMRTLKYTGDGFLEVSEASILVGNGEVFKVPPGLASRLLSDFNVDVEDVTTGGKL